MNSKYISPMKEYYNIYFQVKYMCRLVVTKIFFPLPICKDTNDFRPKRTALKKQLFWDKNI